MDSLEIDIYDCRFKIVGSGGTALREVENDFQYFRSERVVNPITVELFTQDPPYDTVPHGVATIYTPRNVSLTHNNVTYTDYGGQALGVWEPGRDMFRVYSRNLDIQYEATYLFLLSKIGEYLDKKRMHRMHAMAMALDGRAILVLLPMGGGKSTLTQGLLRYPDLEFLSDDSPLISRVGRVHAFPLRLGVLPNGEQSHFPKEQTRVIQRMEFGPKILVNYQYFADRVRDSADPGIVFLGRRSLSNECRIEKATFGEKYHSMMVNCVIGLGLFQGLEFLLNRSPFELVSKLGVLWSRFRNAKALFSESEVYRLILGRNLDHNAETVYRFVQERLK